MCICFWIRIDNPCSVVSFSFSLQSKINSVMGNNDVLSIMVSRLAVIMSSKKLVGHQTTKL